MTAPEVLTYSSIVTQLPSYCERVDSAFEDQIPFFVMLAENRIATDMKQQGFQSVVSGNFTAGAAGASFAKPAFWRETISFTYTDPTTGTKPINLRSLEYVKAFTPLRTTLGAPRFYADYNVSNFLVAPSPDAGYAFELVYQARLQPLSDENQTNWLTVNAPQVLLYACILEAQLWCKNPDKIAQWQGFYDAARGGIIQENQERLTDRAEVVTRP